MADVHFTWVSMTMTDKGVASTSDRSAFIEGCTPVSVAQMQQESIDGCEVDFDVLSVALRFVFFDCISTDSLFWIASALWKAHKQGVPNPCCYSEAQQS